MAKQGRVSWNQLHPKDETDQSHGRCEYVWLASLENLTGTDMQVLSIGARDVGVSINGEYREVSCLQYKDFGMKFLIRNQ